MQQVNISSVINQYFLSNRSFEKKNVFHIATSAFHSFFFSFPGPDQFTTLDDQMNFNLEIFNKQDCTKSIQSKAFQHEIVAAANDKYIYVNETAVMQHVGQTVAYYNHFAHFRLFPQELKMTILCNKLVEPN